MAALGRVLFCLLPLVWLTGCHAADTTIPTVAISAEVPPPPPPTPPPNPALVSWATVLPPLSASPTATLPPAPTSTPTCTQPGQIVTGTYPSLWNGESRYRIYLPPCYGQSNQPYPTLYLLPGNIHDDSIWDTLGIDDSAETLIASGALPPLLIVMADAGTLYNQTSGGVGSYESQILDDLIPFIEANYCARRDDLGRALGGLSRGGYWALEIAFRHPQRFASVGGHSAALVDTYAWPAVNPQVTGATLPLGDLRVLLDIGETDGYRWQLETLHNDMAAVGASHDWWLLPGAHTEAYWSGNTVAYLMWYAEGWGDGISAEGCDHALLPS